MIEDEENNDFWCASIERKTWLGIWNSMSWTRFEGWVCWVGKNVSRRIENNGKVFFLAAVEHNKERSILKKVKSKWKRRRFNLCFVIKSKENERLSTTNSWWWKTICVIYSFFIHSTSSQNVYLYQTRLSINSCLWCEYCLLLFSSWTSDLNSLLNWKIAQHRRHIQ